METRVKWSSLTKTIICNVGKNPAVVQWRVVASDVSEHEFVDLITDPEWIRIVEKTNAIPSAAPLHKREKAALQLKRYLENRRRELRVA